MRWLAILVMTISSPSLAENEALKNHLLAPLIPAELLSYSDFQIPARENVEVISDGTHDFVEPRMLPGQNLTNGGDRAEISVDYPFLEGDTVSYQWQVRLPSDSQADPQSRWWILAQWHDQPDRRIGETWAEFTLRSPPIAMIYDTIEGQESIALYYGAPDPESQAFAPIFRHISPSGDSAV